MSQFLRPDGDITTTNINSGNYTSIDETSANDADYIQTGGVYLALPSTYECSLSNPSGTPAAATIRHRLYRSSGTLPISGFISLRQGATQIDSEGFFLNSGTPTTYEWTPDVSGVTDWDDLRLRWVFQTTGEFDFSVARITWAEVEAFAVFDETITETVAASDSYTRTAVLAVTLTETVTAADLYGLVFNETISETLTASDSFLGGTDYYQTINESLAASDAYAATVTEPNGWIIPAPPTDGWVQQGSGGGAWTEVSDTDTDWTEI